MPASKTHRIDTSDDAMFAVKSSASERSDFEDLAIQMPDLIRAGGEGKKQLPRFMELQHDAYNFFHNRAPVINTETSEAITPHTEIISAMEGMQEATALRTKTAHDRLASAVAVKKLNSIVENLPDEVKRAAHLHQCNQNALQDAKQRLEQLREFWKMKKMQMDETGDQAIQDKLDELAEKGHEAADTYDMLEENADKGAEALDTAVSNEDSGIRVAIREALAQASQEVEAVKEAMNAFGTGCGNEAGFPLQIPEVEALKMADRVSNDAQLQRIAEIAGRMQRINEQVKKQMVASVGGGIVGIEQGREIHKLTPNELANVADPDTEMLMWQRVVEGKAEVWKTEAEESKGLGPMIIMQDGSGSTAGDIFNWESGMALALRQECAQRGQPFYWIHFDIQTEFRKFDGEGQELEAAEWAQTFMGGGTNPAQALFAAMDCLQDDVDFSDADVVLFSDGIFSPPDVICAQFRNKLDEFGARCMGVYMGGDPQQGIESTSFGPICDQAWNFDIRHANTEGEIEFLTELFSETSR
jgi:uncharacterized protein with von Willebrand factor type A (vWA) domain